MKQPKRFLKVRLWTSEWKAGESESRWQEAGSWILTPLEFWTSRTTEQHTDRRRGCKTKQKPHQMLPLCFGGTINSIGKHSLYKHPLDKLLQKNKVQVLFLPRNTWQQVPLWGWTDYRWLTTTWTHLLWIWSVRQRWPLALPLAEDTAFVAQSRWQ